jgi:3-methyl-2-oxobutanoate hydroxymethyltransferase
LGQHAREPVRVVDDGFEDRLRPRFVRRYAELGADATAAVARFADDVRVGRFPSSDETYHMTDQLDDAMDQYSVDVTEAEPASGPAPRVMVTPPG